MHSGSKVPASDRRSRALPGGDTRGTGATPARGPAGGTGFPPRLGVEFDLREDPEGRRADRQLEELRIDASELADAAPVGGRDLRPAHRQRPAHRLDGAEP